MPDRTRILHLVAHDGNWEPFIRIASLAAALREHGFHSLVAAPDHSRLWELSEAAGVEMLDYTLTSSFNPLRWRELGNLIKSADVGLVHLHDRVSGKLLSWARMFAGSIAVVATRYEIESSYGNADYGSGIDCVAAPSHVMKKEYLESGAPEDKLAVVYAGINIATADRAGEERDVLRATFRQQYCPDKEKPLFLINIAPLDESSHQMALLEVLPDILAARPQTHAVIMGEGPLLDDLQRRRKILALENDVTIVEPDKAYHRLLAAGDCYVAMSADDGAGLMVQAAMAAGRGVVATSSGCYAELVDDGKTGVVVPREEVKDAIIDMLQNRTRREHLGRLAKAKAQKSFLMADRAGEMAALYNRALDKKAT
ncbi:MAG: glycosyltransferase family 4 protein [Planctomycetaceae bacterium]|nr:glycosyltransferase family 4 protein [Planctomycetaceae bacterium]